MPIIPKQHRRYALICMVLPLVATSCIQSNTARRDKLTQAAGDGRNSEKSEIYSSLINYCEFGLVDNTNALSKCQLYCYWSEALERKLRLEKANIGTIRRRVAEPCIAGLKVATDSSANFHISTIGDVGVVWVDDCDSEQLAKYRAFFKQRIVDLYSQSPDELNELKRLVVAAISDCKLASEIIETVNKAQYHKKE